MTSPRVLHQAIKASFLHRVCFRSSFSKTKQSNLSAGRNKMSQNMEWIPIQIPIRQRPVKLIVFRNYLLPERPRKYKEVHTFLSYSGKYSTLSTKQLMFEVKNMSEEKKEIYQKKLKQQNQLIQQEQKVYDKIFVKTLKKLPFYYHMLLAQTQLPGNQSYENIQANSRQNEVKQTSEIKKIDQNQQQSTAETIFSFKEIQNYFSKTLTPHEMFMKLYTIHPYLKYSTYLRYTSIHNQFTKKHKTVKVYSPFFKFTFRLPILYFRHPYELFIIDQCERNQKKLKLQQFYMKMEDILDFDNKWTKLEKRQKQKYQDKAQKLLMEYETQIQKIMLNTKLSRIALFQLIENQFSLENQRMFNK